MEPENLSSPAADDEAALQPSTAEAPDAEESSAEIRPEPETPPARAMLTADDIGRMLAEAEQRGYLRGLNEKAEASLAEPGPYEEVHPPRPNHPHSASPLVESAARPSIWDIF